MRNPFQRINDRVCLGEFRKKIVGHFGRIQLVSFQDNHDDFLRTITAALELIREYDPRRYRRVAAQTDWIADFVDFRGKYAASYRASIRATLLDFEYDEGLGDHLTHTAYYAGAIVHEATHGQIHQRGIPYSKENRAQIERICKTEENRFLGRLDTVRPGLGTCLQRPFDVKGWKDAWEFAPVRKSIRAIRRLRAKEKAERSGGKA